VSAKAGWYPDPGGGQGLFRYWDGKSWSAATSPNPGAPPPTQGLASIGQPAAGSTLGQTSSAYGQGGNSFAPGSSFGPASSFGQGSSFGPGSPPGYGAGNPSAYANYQQIQKKKSPVGWWIAGAALVVVIVVVAVLAIRAVTSGAAIPATPGGGPVSQDTCPPKKAESQDPNADPNDGRVHGGPLSYPTLGDPWGAPEPDDRVPFGTDVLSQQVVVEPNYAPNGASWVASVLVGELQAGDGFFTPEQGSQIVVKCIIGAFYGNAEVGSNVKKNAAVTIDGHDGWIVESQLSFDIPGLKTKGELLIVVIVSAGPRSGLYYASIPDTTPQLVQPARGLIKQLTVTE
jgi:hypothetical protein